MKKFILLLIILSWCLPASAASFDWTDPSAKPTIGIFLEAPPTYVNNETVRKIVPEKTKAFFPETAFNVLPFDTTAMALRTYKEDHRMNVNQYYSQPINRQDMQSMSKDLNCDYALFVIINNDAPRVSAGMFSVSFKTTVTCDVRVLDVASGKYLSSKAITKDGSSTSVMMGVPSFDNAYNEALKKALDEMTIDTKLLVKPAQQTTNM